ncbi:MAG: hypothetical protein R3E01_07330 [Pirellulaceae bacterium]|nr:hypothetical protein [Planctomycetales bacterium]
MSVSRKSLMASAGTCVLCLFVGVASAATNYEEHWDAGDTNGWIGSTTSSTVVRDNADGNPASSIVVRRDLSPPVFDMGVTSELADVTGNYGGVPGWMLSFDAKYDIGNFADTLVRFRYQDATFNGWHLDVADAFPANSWQSYSVTFDPNWTDAQATANGWVDETGGAVSWQQLMGDVYHPEIRFVMGDELSAIAHVDNVVLKSVPEPTMSALGLWGLLGAGMLVRRKYD